MSAQDHEKRFDSVNAASTIEDSQMEDATRNQVFRDPAMTRCFKQALPAACPNNHLTVRFWNLLVLVDRLLKPVLPGSRDRLRRATGSARLLSSRRRRLDSEPQPISRTKTSTKVAEISARYPDCSPFVNRPSRVGWRIRSTALEVVRELRDCSPGIQNLFQKAS
jgi:hypothetical protein